MKNLFILIPFLFLTTYLFAQQSVTVFQIKGQVVDSTDKKGIPYATISILKMPEKTAIKKLATNDNGMFEATIKDTGNYQITTQFIGYSNFEKLVNVNKSTTIYDLGKLEIAQATTQIKGIEIIAEKPLVKVEADKITYSAESDPETKTISALDMLRKVPLVSVDGDDNIQVKGSGNFKVLLNGKESAIANKNPKDFFKSLPASLIKNIEVITSPGAKYDAEGIGGLINIVTEKNKIQGYNGSVNVGANSIGRYNLGGNLATSFGKFSSSLSLYYNQSTEQTQTGYTYRENFYATNERYNVNNSTNRFKNNSMWGTGEMSYEIDTLNLISASIDFWRGGYSSNSLNISDAQDLNKTLIRSFSINSISENQYGEPEGNVDYQHTFKQNKEQILTISYKFAYQPDNSKNNSIIDNTFNYPQSKQNTQNNAHSFEQTLQADYVQPINKTNSIEAGTKYILRKNISNADIEKFDYEKNQYVDAPEKKDDLNYSQQIAALYFSYKVNIGKFSIKAGVRAENSVITGTFVSKNYTDFENKNLDYVPNVNISYQMSQSQSLRLSYNRRIQRPAIWYLNPFVNDADSANIFHGNPNLKPEQYDNIDFNYGNFGKLGSLNLTLSYSQSNNDIEQYSTIINNKIRLTTFDNINKLKRYTVSVFTSLNLGKKITARVNASTNYNTIQNNLDESNKVEGFSYNGNGNIQYTIVDGLKCSAYGGLFQNAKSLQTTYSPYYYYGISISKDLFDKKLSVSLGASDFFNKQRKWENETNTSAYYSKSEYLNPGRNVRINISYRFGEMNGGVKKAQRGIENDDVKGGGKKE